MCVVSINNKLQQSEAASGVLDYAMKYHPTEMVSCWGVASAIYLLMCICLFAVCVSVCLFVCLSGPLSVCLSICLSVCLSVCLSICLSVCLSVCLSICLFVCLYVCLSVCVYIYFDLAENGRIVV